MLKKMGQKKVSKRKYINPKLEEDKNEKDVHVPDNAKVLLIAVAKYFYIYSCLWFHIEFKNKNVIYIVQHIVIIIKH